MSLASEPRKICLYLKSISCKNSIFTEKNAQSEILLEKLCINNFNLYLHVIY